MSPRVACWGTGVPYREVHNLFLSVAATVVTMGYLHTFCEFKSFKSAEGGKR